MMLRGKFNRLLYVMITGISFLVVSELLPLMHNHSAHQAESVNCPAYVLQLSLQASGTEFSSERDFIPDPEFFIEPAAASDIIAQTSLHPLSNKAPPSI